MEGSVKGDVVIVPFPFSDLSTVKRRPALVVAVPAGTTSSSARSRASRSGIATPSVSPTWILRRERSTNQVTSGQTGSFLPVPTCSSTGPAVSTTRHLHRSSIGSSRSCRQSNFLPQRSAGNLQLQPSRHPSLSARARPAFNNTLFSRLSYDAFPPSPPRRDPLPRP